MLIGNAEFELILWHTNLLEACLKPRKMKAKVQSKNIQLNHCMKTADPIYLLLCESFIKWVRSRLQQSVTIIANLQTKSSLRPRGRVQLPLPWGGLATVTDNCPNIEPSLPWFIFLNMVKVYWSSAWVWWRISPGWNAVRAAGGASQCSSQHQSASVSEVTAIRVFHIIWNEGKLLQICVGFPESLFVKIVSLAITRELHFP